jgi:hypothetical protein
MGPGGHVECLSKEAQVYMQQMLKIYRFAIQYEMEDLAERTIDEIQAHELRCNGYPVMPWIQSVYEFSEPGSTLRLYCAASLYHSGISGIFCVIWEIWFSSAFILCRSTAEFEDGKSLDMTSADPPVNNLFPVPFQYLQICH